MGQYALRLSDDEVARYQWMAQRACEAEAELPWTHQSSGRRCSSVGSSRSVDATDCPRSEGAEGTRPRRRDCCGS